VQIELIAVDARPNTLFGIPGMQVHEYGLFLKEAEDGSKLVACVAVE